MFFYFFKQNTAYEMRISDWSSDVCSSDLASCRACSAEILATFRARVRALIRRLFEGTEPQPPEPALWDDVRRRARWVAALDADRDARMQALAARFLRDQAITPVGDLALDAAEIGRASCRARVCKYV